mmetsp:Transcript_54881/g.153076  ORF Transcript_54881/g.153076 Transcript_54881/m.153076 type:complete len:274 (-) Transcript_54881:199-1020(-)
MKGPTSASFLFPPASVSPDAWMMVSPQPSATTTTACCLRRMRFATWSKNFGKETFISGMRQTSTCRLANDAVAAIHPQWRPMSLTRPMQFPFVVASTCAEAMAFSASVHAVLKPKLWSKTGMSLSMVLGTPTTAHSWPSAVISLKIDHAPLWVPSPPSTKNCLMFRRCMTLAISACGGFPRSETRMLPPCRWMSCTASSVRRTHSSSFTQPLKPPRMPQTLVTPYVLSMFASSRITEFKPGQRPPQVTIAAPAPVSAGSKCSTSLAPLRSSCK